jgi:DNA-binding NtrC family response regulator
MDRRTFLGTMVVGFLAQAVRLSPASAVSLDGLIGESPAIEGVRRSIRRLAQPWSGRRNVMLQGECGSGKSLGADLLVRLGRPGRPMMDVNWAAAPPELLFGMLEEARGGTLIFDEADVLDPVEQHGLLEALRPLSATTWIINKVRRPSVTVRGGRMRPDLSRLLADEVIEIPPLRDRRGDVLILAKRLIDRFSRQYDLPPAALTLDARELITTYSWPGNVRELSHQVERAVILAEDSRITADLLGPEYYVTRQRMAGSQPSWPRAFPLDAAAPSSTTL